MALLEGNDDAAFQEFLKNGARWLEMKKNWHYNKPIGELSMDCQRARNRYPADPVVMYERLCAQGLQYGPAFRTIESAHYNDAAMAAGRANAGGKKK